MNLVTVGKVIANKRITLKGGVDELLGVKIGDSVKFIIDEETGRIYIEKVTA